MSEECKIIDSINVVNPESIIQTPCGTFLIGVEGDSIFKYCLETRQKFRIAGSVGEEGHQDGTRDEARFNCPTSLTLSKDLKTLFVADAWNRVIRAICIGTGITTTFAGQVNSIKSIDGPKEKACFQDPTVLKLSPDENMLLVSEFNKLRTICIATGQVNTIHTFEKGIRDFTLSPDSKHVYICIRHEIVKYNLETNKSEIILKGEDLIGCELSKDGQLLFISNRLNRNIKIANFVTNKVIDTITTSFKPGKIIVSTNCKQLYVNDYENNKIQVLDISKYCTNFKIFLKSQLAKHSFLSQAVVKRMLI